MVFVLAHGIRAVDKDTGRIVWQRELDAFGTSVAVAGSRVYIGARDVSGENPAPGRMYALDVATGATVWSAPIAGNPAWTPAVSGNRVFLGSYTEVRGIKSYRLEAFDIADGHRHWRVSIGQSRYLTFSAAAVAGSRIVVPSPSGYLYAHDVTTGARLWRTELRVTDSAPAIANRVVYVGSSDGRLHAFRLDDGRRLWSARLGDKPVTSSPTVVNGAVYVGSDDGNVVAFGLRR